MRYLLSTKLIIVATSLFVNKKFTLCLNLFQNDEQTECTTSNSLSEIRKSDIFI